MTYLETVEFLYAKLPAFQNIGNTALKPKLTNIIKLCSALGNPQEYFKCIHIAGTNGKGSSSHFITSILIEKGLKVGLYTSPHLKDFRERFKVNGIDASENYIIDFIEQHKDLIEEVQPSFFELTVVLAFQFFKDQCVEIAVIEVGLGGRFDSTNIIQPILCLITNIGFDHMEILGDTIPKIANEKAGIIKSLTPVVISEYNSESAPVFKTEALKNNAKIVFANELFKIENIESSAIYLKLIVKNILNSKKLVLDSGLVGEYQISNILGVLSVIEQLNILNFNISSENITNGIRNVISNTNLKGRWQILAKSPLTICDTGHNEHALKLTLEKVNQIKGNKKHLIFGFVKDKDLKNIVGLFPKDANYYFCTFNSFRSLKINELKLFAKNNNLNAHYYENVNIALAEANRIAKANDLIFIGGSTYLVAEINNL